MNDPLATSGIVVVDKPAGMTSHDVVARLRRIFGTRKVGHAGTLDPMATGVLVAGIERGTKLLAHLVAQDKVYETTIRLGAATTTDDAEGDVVEKHDASGVTDGEVRAEAAKLTGAIMQVPSKVSAIKIGGRRAHELVRAGEEVEIPPREVTVHSFDLGEIRRHGEFVDVDARVHCSSGTYIRSLGRDMGAALGVGGASDCLATLTRRVVLPRRRAHARAARRRGGAVARAGRGAGPRLAGAGRDGRGIRRPGDGQMARAA